MGIFDFWKAPEERRASEVRRGSVTPSRNERQRCWEARDTYFACLDRSNILDAVKDAEAAHKACPAEEAAFERDCAKAWVSPRDNESKCLGITRRAEGPTMGCSWPAKDGAEIAFRGDEETRLTNWDHAHLTGDVLQAVESSRGKEAEDEGEVTSRGRNRIGRGGSTRQIVMLTRWWVGLADNALGCRDAAPARLLSEGRVIEPGWLNRLGLAWLLAGAPCSREVIWGHLALV